MITFKDKLAGIEYAGFPGISLGCQEAVMRLLQFRDQITLARILSCEGTHCLLLTVNEHFVGIKSGFSSGYGGEGPRRFSYVIQLLEAHGVEIEEYEVNRGLLERLDQSALTLKDIKTLDQAKAIRPIRWPEYRFDKHYEQFRAGSLWQEFTPMIPLGLIDSRIADLVVSFWDNPDNTLLTAYRRLEDIVRTRSGLREGSARLFGQVFGGDNPILTWKGIGDAEKVGRLNLFTGSFIAHRNPRAHGEPNGRYHNRLLSEFLLLNHLYHLEKEAQKVR